MGNYKELFVSQFLDYYHHVTVVFDVNEKRFYNTLFEGVQCGGICAHTANRKGEAISIEIVRKLARESEDSRAGKYVNISEDNWQELLDW